MRPEPANPYDNNAVVVLAEGQPVVYLARQAAADWQPMILAAEAEGFIVAGNAEIFGGPRRSQVLALPVLARTTRMALWVGMLELVAMAAK